MQSAISMGRVSLRVYVFGVLMLLLFSSLQHISARSVDSTVVVDIFPQGDISSNGPWELDDGVTFTTDGAQYTEAMVEDDRITLEHARPYNYESFKMWSQNSPSDSTNAIGVPDLQYDYTNGPVIELTDFDTSPYLQYKIVSVSVLIAFHIPDALQQDQVRITMNYDGDYEELATYVTTQGPIDYMNGSIWTHNISQVSEWTWQDLSAIIFTLDYVSDGTTDDTRLDIDALGLLVVVEYPWYGTEWASVESTSQDFEMPVKSVDLSDGVFNGMQISECGINPSNNGVEGIWTSSVISTEPGQKLGRLHFTTTGEVSGDLVVEYSESSDGQSFSEFYISTNNGLIDSNYVMLRFKSSETCISSIMIDYNDPTLEIEGKIFGSLDGISTDYSRWKVFINDFEATFQPVGQLGSFNLQLPIGQYLQPGVNPLKVKIQAWFNWDSNGNASTTLLEISSLTVTGGFEVHWDEDPVCPMIGPQYFEEDGLGILIPYLDSCQDDRTTSENLSVSFTVANQDLISASMSQQDIKLVLMPEEFGVTSIMVEVEDSAGNSWTESFLVYVQEIDDSPSINEFPSSIPVESNVSTTIGFTYSDIDSQGLTAYTDKSWASVDLNTSTVTVNPPSLGSSIPVLVTVCDQSNCVNRTMLLEVNTLAELSIEDVVIEDDDIVEGDVVTVMIYVRNSGQAEATSISVRCQSETALVGIKSIPLLSPGELDVVTCDWRVYESGNLNLSIELDRINEISEGDETNNFATITIEVSEEKSDDASSGVSINSRTVWILTMVILAGIITLFVVYAPGKIKKIE